MLSEPTHGRPPRGLRLRDMLTVTDQTDESGRLLLEDSAPKRARKRVQSAGIAMKTVSCPYQDTPSRLGGDMNASAYEALRHDTAEILNGFAWLAEGWLGENPGRARGTVQALLDTSNLGVTLPMMLFHRAPDGVPAHGAMPTYVASLFKAGRGLFSVAFDMLNNAGGGAAPITVEGVVEFAESKGHLRRPQTRRVCAAPTRLIERTIDAILTGQGAEPAKSGLAGLVDFPPLWSFYSVQRKFSRSCSDYRYVLENLTRSTGGSDPKRMFGSTVQVEGRTWSFGALTDAFVEYANIVQNDLNRLLGRADDAPAITFEEALRIL